MFFCSVVNTAVLSCICFSVAECDSGFGFVDEIANGLRPSIAPDVDARVVGLIADCWDADPDSRPTFSEVCRF